ncbi:MAG: bifunctional biotin-- synthetase/biotin operon repressor [Cenarchaeum symbiont of Oopsacas minuta]|nr:bifunctional biotin-- synthetase/biotin operon repressor [Cenarchaeum symbiont of Oopsacas minuta]
MYTSYDPPRFVRILDLLKEHGSEYLSGQDLGDALKISRTAVWKHIDKLRTLGYDIKSDRIYGYKLESTSDLIYPWEVIDGLETKFLGKIVHYFDSISSTQDYAIELAKDSEKKGSIVLADQQSAGRGRGKNSWISPRGGIWMSVIIDMPLDSESTLLPIAAAVALAKTIQEIVGTRTELKWPNDILVNGNKVAGIIIDGTIKQDRPSHIVLGVGINYNITVENIKKTIKQNNVASLHGNITRVIFIQKFLSLLEDEIMFMNHDDGKRVIKRWMAESCTIGTKISAESQGTRVNGVAIRLESDGSLVLQNGSNMYKIVSGTIS